MIVRGEGNEKSFGQASTTSRLKDRLFIRTASIRKTNSTTKRREGKITGVEGGLNGKGGSRTHLANQKARSG